jgi:Mg-chelatase subunit ChlD
LNRAIEDQDKAVAAEAKVQQEFFGQPGNGEVQAATSSSEALVEEQAGKKPLTPLALSMVDQSKRKSDEKEVAQAPAVVAPPAPVPQPEVASEENPISTFSLNVSDVSFKLAGASLDNGQLPGPSTVRTEEFLNAFHYRDPDPAPGRPVAFAWERAQFPFAQQRDVVRLSVRTGAIGREANRPLNVVLLLDSSGSMERADRVSTLREALKVLGNQMMPQDRVSVVSFARTARLWIDGLPGDQASNLADRVGELAPEGGTHLEEALRVGYDTARKHFTPEGVNRVVLLTDGAANLGELRAEALREMVESNRKRGVALDCFGVGFDGYQDDLLEALSRNGDGRYGFVNSPEEVSTGFANQLAGALQVAAADVKVQVEFNSQRVQRWRQIGYAKHQLTQEQFRDNTVDAAEIGAAESGNALYVIEPNARGTGPIGTVRVRFRDPASGNYSEQEWAVPYEGPAQPLEQSSPALRLATAAAAFGEMLSASPYASEVSNDRLIALLNGVPENFSPDPRPERLLNMVRQAQSILGR